MDRLPGAWAGRGHPWGWFSLCLALSSPGAPELTLHCQVGLGSTTPHRNATCWEGHKKTGSHEPRKGTASKINTFGISHAKGQPPRSTRSQGTSSQKEDFTSSHSRKHESLPPPGTHQRLPGLELPSPAQPSTLARVPEPGGGEEVPNPTVLWDWQGLTHMCHCVARPEPSGLPLPSPNPLRTMLRSNRSYMQIFGLLNRTDFVNIVYFLNLVFYNVLPDREWLS